MHDELLLAGLHRAIAAWAFFERSIDLSVWNTIGVPIKIGAKITQNIQSIRNKLVIIEDVLEEINSDPSDLKQLRSFRNKIESLTRFRNRLVHDPVQVIGGKAYFYRGNTFPKAAFVDNGDATILTADEISKFADTCYAKTIEYLRLHRQVCTRAGIGPSREKPE